MWYAYLLLSIICILAAILNNLRRVPNAIILVASKTLLCCIADIVHCAREYGQLKSNHLKKYSLGVLRFNCSKSQSPVTWISLQVQICKQPQ